ncbi:MAG: ASCH domain-containing protein [Patescibacteria group bacterium]|uniref:ASCH domain-containing protein n=1 Tax=candidate division WWE3 bacterium TaxID=2053526 RepID=A0A955J362_UNCKA|nr:ASCH domain-containing protein [candidate division WWE3 bacterium]
MAIHSLLLRNRPFNAIKNGTKTVEVRANKKVGRLDYATIEKGDHIVFINEETKETLKCNIENVKLYKDVRKLLVEEGVKNTLSSGGDLDAGVKSIESITNYKKVIAEKGVFAYRLRVIND